ncbi:Fanconi anemia group M protein isoform X1 [Diorhabda sublineata]|uniref:Fanconi anemia group M protein isoform X1 n=1 Tax=Diorhabda sublineata TaxID=1163346 RepID=UPI0024E052B9|nr:Fanconi anemia group M protein isoform X1 [Diorhabda sublineata]
MSDNLNRSLGLHLSTDPETQGFDLQAGETWIYPTNYPVREYQFNITQKALLKNTLVSLPTGLGKTFIAAVVMFNFFRWYPLGKVVFMAPTRPLVKQQIDACYDIMAIPRDSTIEMTGTKLASSREEMWNKKRVFFVTPQILQNDLDKFESLGPKIKCLVFDEAHRARGNHAYCEVIRKLSNSNKFFRVLALSATPGGTIGDVLEVVQNLLISHLEFRTEESLDVRSYVFQRNLTTVVVPLGGKLQEIKDSYMKVLEYYTRALIKYKVIQGNCANLTKGKVFMLMKQYQTNNKGTSPNYGEIMKSLNICITLYHAVELLVRHGLRSFLNFFEEHIEKPLFRGNTEIRAILSNIREYIGPLPQVLQLPSGEYSQILENVKFGHPKFYKLRDILLDHFKENGDSSKAIVFFEYRDSVTEASVLLIQSQPLIKPRIFVGQKQGVTQKSQINVVKAFREGRCNVLLSTSIGEEGLDVGEVDLIVCFDISNKSPIRMVQRMGRTGRKKDGNVVVLVTEGKEQQTLKDCLIHKNNVAYHVLGSKELANSMMSEYARLIPEGLVPKCEKIFITVQKDVSNKGGNLKSMLKTLSSTLSESIYSPDLKIVDVEEKIPEPQLYCIKEDPFEENDSLPNIFSKRIEKQRSFQETDRIEHSSNCDIFVKLLQFAESRRFNIPLTQHSNNVVQNKNLKQTDIRHMFFKSQSANDFVLPSSEGLPQPVEVKNVEDKNFNDRKLFEEIDTFLTIKKDEGDQCHLCPSQFNCGKLKYGRKTVKTVLTWIELDASVYINITEQDLKNYGKNFNDSKCQSFQFEESMNFKLPDTPRNKISIQKEKETLQLEDLLDSSIINDIYNKTTNFEAPKSLKNLLNRYSTSIIDSNDSNNAISQQKSVKNEDKGESNQKILDFFKLKSLDNIFDTITSDSQDTIIYSPDLFDDVNKEDSCSPILCSYVDKKRPKKYRKNDSIAPTQNKETTDETIPLELDDLLDFTFFELPSNKKVATKDKIDAVADNALKKSKSSEKLDNHKVDLDISDFIDEELLKSPELSIKTSVLERKQANRVKKLEGKNNFNGFEANKEIDITLDEDKDVLALEIELSKNTIDVNEEKQSCSDEIRDYNHEDHFARYLETGETVEPQKDELNSCFIGYSFNFQNSTDCKEPVSEKLTEITNRDKFKDFSQFKKPKSINSKNDSKVPNISKKEEKDPSQLTVTQIISLVNKNTTDWDENLSDFDFSFETTTSSSEKSCTNSSTDTIKSKNNASKANKSNNECRKKINFVNTSNSDDEFETKPKSPLWIRRKPLIAKLHTEDSDDEFETTVSSAAFDKTKPVKEKVVRKYLYGRRSKASSSGRDKKLVNDFIQNEAELSICDEIIISDDEDELLTQDCYDASFVADNTIRDDTQMQAVYLKSIKDVHPINRFKIPTRYKNRSNVFSQQVEEEEEEEFYLDDSFVVHDESIETNVELSQLEILEKQLENRKKRKKILEDNKKPTKRKRIIVDSDSD